VDSNNIKTTTPRLASYYWNSLGALGPRFGQFSQRYHICSYKSTVFMIKVGTPTYVKKKQCGGEERLSYGRTCVAFSGGIGVSSASMQLLAPNRCRPTVVYDVRIDGANSEFLYIETCIPIVPTNRLLFQS
jgi:hypothetical protein